MTQQEKIILIGGAGALVTKFYFQKSWMLAGIIGLASISVYSIVTAQNNATS